MMDGGQGSIAETVLRSPSQEALVVNPASALPPPEVQPYLALYNSNQHGQHKALPPLSDDEIDLHRFNVSGRVGRPKHERNAELLISNVMTRVKDGFANCAVAFDSDISIDHVPFKEDQFQKLPKKGEGVSSFVTAYKDKSGKKFVRKHLKDGTKLREQEIMSMLKLKHPNICKLYAVIFHWGSVDIIMQDGGQPLYAFIEEQQNRLGPRASSWYYRVVQDLACQGFQALHYMHKHYLYHLDIKPDNILVDSTSENQFRLMLADFGSSLTGNQLMSFSMQLTPEYFAPELWQRLVSYLRSKADYNRLQEEQFPPQASFDIYAMGLTVYFMCTRRHLLKFQKLKDNDRQTSCNFMAQLMIKYPHCIGDLATKGPFFHKPLPQVLHELLTNTLHADPNKRWTASNALECLSCDVECMSAVEEDEKEKEKVKLQVSTQVDNTVSHYAAESTIVQEAAGQSTVAVQDTSGCIIGTESFCSSQDINVFRRQKLVRNVQTPASRDKLTVGAPANLPPSFLQSMKVTEAKSHTMPTNYYPMQLNSSLAFMELEKVSFAAVQGNEGHGVDPDLCLHETTLQNCVPDVAILSELCQAEEKPAGALTQFGKNVAPGTNVLSLRRNVKGDCTQPFVFEGKSALGILTRPLAPDIVNDIPPPETSLEEGRSTYTPLAANSKKGKAFASKGRIKPYDIKPTSAAGKHAKRMVILEEQLHPKQDSPTSTFFVASSIAPTPVVHTIQEVAAKALQFPTKAGYAVAATAMHGSSSISRFNVWSVETNEQAQPTAMRPLPVQPQDAFEINSPSEGSFQGPPLMLHQGGSIPNFDLLL